MKHIYLLFSLFFIGTITCFSQTPVSNVQNAAIPKDAPVDVNVTDFKKNPLANEIVILKSKINGKEYQGLTNGSGQFSVRLPSGDSYEMYVLGFKDSSGSIILDIPAPVGNAYYKKPFVVNLEFLSAKTIVLQDVNFETGKAELEPESFVALDELVAFLNRKEDERIEVGGHTDNVGTVASNLKLSDARANTVRDYLIAKGIEASRITAKGYGSSVPVESNKTEEGRAQNRRTEAKFLD